MSSVEAIDTEISPAITIPLSNTRSRISANVEPWVDVAIVRLAFGLDSDMGQGRLITTHLVQELVMITQKFLARFLRTVFVIRVDIFAKVFQLTNPIMLVIKELVLMPEKLSMPFPKAPFTVLNQHLTIMLTGQ
jgi:hypothetical protein